MCFLAHRIALSSGRRDGGGGTGRDTEVEEQRDERERAQPANCGGSRGDHSKACASRSAELCTQVSGYRAPHKKISGRDEGLKTYETLPPHIRRNRQIATGFRTNRRQRQTPNLTKCARAAMKIPRACRKGEKEKRKERGEGRETR